MRKNGYGALILAAFVMPAVPARAAAYDVIVQPTPDGFWHFNPDGSSELKWSPTGNYNGGGYYYVDNWGDAGLFNDSLRSARVYYYPPQIMPYDERTYNIYAWNPTANSDQWHILNVQADGWDRNTQDISWVGQFGTNQQWIQFPADSSTIAHGAWVKLGPGPQTDSTLDGGSGVYFNPEDGYSDPTAVHAPKVYVQYQPDYYGAIAFTAIRIVEITPPASSGDFDMDGDVDGNDFILWQRGNSPNSGNAADLALWKSHFGIPVTASVPEPTGALIVLIGAGILGGIGHARKRRRLDG